MRSLWLLLLCSCATVSTSGMSDSCKVAYETCLNNCPSAPRQGEVGAPPSGPSQARIDPSIASCTAACNERANACK
jgi:hypothetical protein